MISESVWTTLLGLSLLFVGGFVLWVYGTQTPPIPKPLAGPEGDSIRKFLGGMAQWYFLFGLFATLLGAGCLLTSAIMIF